MAKKKKGPKIQAHMALVIDFDRGSMGRYSKMSHKVLRLGLERAQHHLWGNKVDAFGELMGSTRFNPMLRVDSTYRLPESMTLHKKVRRAVREYNRGPFPLTFRDDLSLFTGQYPGSEDGEETVALAAATGGTGTGGGTATHTCVHWEWENGMLVAKYNYTLAPEEEEPGAPAAAAAPASDDPLDYNLMDKILPEAGLSAVYQVVVSLRMRFPLPYLVLPG